MSCPYHELPRSSYWNYSVGRRLANEIDPHLDSALTIKAETRVASAGSCFAQHISKFLMKYGYNYYVTEKAPSFMSKEDIANYGYNVFSARYGNIYTTLQLLQLVQRVLGDLKPADQFWCDKQGRWFDLLRPRVVADGFSSLQEIEHDTRQHLNAVHQLLKNTEVFIFTLGLTEVWLSKADCVAYPTCPGCGSAGVFDESKYEFHNLSVQETTDALSEAIRLIKTINPSIQIVLTVSPVPLIATMEQRHVLQATTYSKSVLRVAAENMIKMHENVHYFASYEIITGTRSAHLYFSADSRTVTDEGVSHVMGVFLKHFCQNDIQAQENAGIEVSLPVEPADSEARDVVCDEEEFFRAVARYQSGDKK